MFSYTLAVFTIFICLFLFIMYLQVRVLFKKNIMKRLCRKIDGISIMLYLSALWLTIIVTLVINNKYFNAPESPLQLNAWGDYLAGFIAPLLLGWLVYGVLLQKREFTSMIGASEAQVTQIEIQQLNTWFNRNIKTIQTIKDSMFLGESYPVNSIAELYYILKDDASKHETYIHIYDDLKNILELLMHIENYLKRVEDNTKNTDIRTSVNDIRKEYNLLFINELMYMKAILTAVYFLIALRGGEDCKAYELYASWLDDDKDIYNQIIILSISDVKKLIEHILVNHESIKLDFNTGNIRT